MANRNISEKPVQPQFLNDQISASERLSICGLNCAPQKHPMTRYRSIKENRKAFREFFTAQQPLFSQTI